MMSFTGMSWLELAIVAILVIGALEYFRRRMR